MFAGNKAENFTLKDIRAQYCIFYAINSSCTTSVLYVLKYVFNYEDWQRIIFKLSKNSLKNTKSFRLEPDWYFTIVPFHSDVRGLDWIITCDSNSEST